MRKIRSNNVLAILLILLIGFPVMLAAQDDPSIETDWDDFSYDLYVRGDQTFIISLGVVFPTVFRHNGNSFDPQFTPPVGGTGSLIYNYYFNSLFFVGGELSGMFINSLRGSSLFIVPLGLRVGTQLIYGRFEFPFTFSLGMAWHTYLDYGYYGMYTKAGVSAYFRATPQWSFGLTADWGWYPQWTSKEITDASGNTVNRSSHGNFVDLKISARYHF